jgi:fibronectin-binding autotransporter adhesin
MKQLFLSLLFLSAFSADAAIRVWTNTLGGNWFDSINWSNGVPGSSDVAYITNNGTYTVYAATGTVSTTVINIGGGTGVQTFIYGTSAGKLFITNSSVRANGVLAITNAGIYGALSVQAGGELQLNGLSGNLQLYNFAITNQGTVTCSNGSLSIGGNNSEITYITNSGLWKITGNGSMNYGGGGRSFFLNTGTLQKSINSGTTTIGMDLINFPSGSVSVLAGTLQLSAFQTNTLGGSFSATSPGTLNFAGTSLEAGAAISGTGLVQLFGGTLLLRTNNLPGLKLSGGQIYIIGTTTFQQAGAITNLTLNGSNLRGTNRVAGTLTCNSGNLLDELTVQPGGQLLLASPGGTQLYSLNLVNQGTVIWSAGGLSVGSTSGTVVSNAGTWIITGDNAMSHGGGNPASFLNYGTVHKTAGTGASSFGGLSFSNQTSGIVEVDTGTIQMPTGYTNAAGTLLLNGGTFNAGGGFNTFGMTGGSLIGNGTNGSICAFDGGTVSPGQSPGFIRFNNGLTLGSNATLVVEGTGTTPGTQYDQLSVVGTVTISNAALQVTSLPSVAPGTTFVIIANDAADPVLGKFNGLAENASISVSGQPFRIHYAGGDGNDVTFVRDIGAGAPQLSVNGGSYSNGNFRLNGFGSASIVFTIQATTNFLQWTNVGTATGDLSGNFNFNDTNASKFRYRFYRTTN